MTVTLRSDTAQVQILHRFQTGSNKHAKKRVKHVIINPYPSPAPIVAPQPSPPITLPWWWWAWYFSLFTDTNVPLTLPPNMAITLPQPPPGGDAGPILPPEQAPPPEPIASASPTLVSWPSPNRPSSSGVVLETKHDFESALPVGWTQVATGHGALSRATGTSLVGNGYLRSLKSVAGP